MSAKQDAVIQFRIAVHVASSMHNKFVYASLPRPGCHVWKDGLCEPWRTVRPPLHLAWFLRLGVL